MKLATYKDGSRDGQLVVVSRDLASAHYATGIATRLQQVLDDWNFISPQLQDLSETLEGGKSRHAFAFDPRLAMAPLPRAGQWVAALPAVQGDAAPRLRQAASDEFLAPHSDLGFLGDGNTLDVAAVLAVATGDVPRAASPDQALEGIRLLMLAGDFDLRSSGPEARAIADDPMQRHPATAFAPVAVTPDELGTAWRGGRPHLRLRIGHQGSEAGHIDTGPAMAFHFGEYIAHRARHRNVRAGSLFGSAPLGEALPVFPGSDTHDGNTLQFEALGPDGQSLFGALVLRVPAPAGTAALGADR